MNKPLEFWFDFASTYSYPTAMRIEELAQQQGVEVIWKAFLLGPLFKQQGWDDSPFKLYPAMGKYMWRDLERICQDMSLVFVKPTVFPRNGLLAARIACYYAAEPWLMEFSRAIFKANFVYDLDISETKVIRACLHKQGLDAESIIAQATSSEGKIKLFQQTEQAQFKGIFGAPSLVVEDELFWGNDRLEQAMDWAKLTRAHTPLVSK